VVRRRLDFMQDDDPYRRCDTGKIPFGGLQIILPVAFFNADATGVRAIASHAVFVATQAAP
jgi:hypothetical protein